MQLIVSLNPSSTSDLSFRWFWLSADMSNLMNRGAGALDELAQSVRQQVGATRAQAWLLMPGARVASRKLEYAEQEKKHLQKILPYQLEDALIDDIDELHFALSLAKNGEVTLAYTRKDFLESVFAALAENGIEVVRCMSAPALLPSASVDNAESLSVGFYGGELWVKPQGFGAFSVPAINAATALALTLREREVTTLAIYAETPEDLKTLQSWIPTNALVESVGEHLQPLWQLDYNAPAIDLCQGDFAQRLPLDRWWRAWKSIAILVGVGFAAYLLVSFLSINQLKRENIEVARALEAEARKVIPEGRLVNIERQVAALMPSGTQASGTKVVAMLSVALPAVAEFEKVEVKGIAFSQENGELNINLQADNFAVFDQIAGKIKASGYAAEIQSANAQGNVQTARLNVKGL